VKLNDPHIFIMILKYQYKIKKKKKKKKKKEEEEEKNLPHLKNVRNDLDKILIQEKFY